MKKDEETWIPNPITDTGKCTNNFMEVTFPRTACDARCQVRLSDRNMKTDGLVLIEKLTSAGKYCLNPGYYYIGCNGETTVNELFDL
jgi:hypothetical protein